MDANDPNQTGQSAPALFPEDPAPNQYAPPPPPLMSEPVNYAPPPSPAAAAMSAKDERMWATFIHLSPVLLGILGSAMGLPIFGFLGPLILWLIKKDESVFINDQGKEALNFSINVTALMVLLIPLVFILIGIPLMIIVGITALIFAIIAAIKANSGVAYRYPLNIRWIK